MRMAWTASMPGGRLKAFASVLMANAARQPDAARLVTREQSGPEVIKSSDAGWREFFRSALISHTLVHGRAPCRRRLVIRRQPLRTKGCRHIHGQLAQTPRRMSGEFMAAWPRCTAGITEGQAVSSPSSPLRVWSSSASILIMQVSSCVARA